MWVYVKITPETGAPFYQVGFYRWGSSELNNGQVQNWQVWQPVETYTIDDQAAQRVNYLNGGNGFPYDLRVPPPPVHNLPQ